LDEVLLRPLTFPQPPPLRASPCAPAASPRWYELIRPITFTALIESLYMSKSIIRQGHLMDFTLIKNSIKADNYEMSLHSLERAIERDIWKEDIENAIIQGEIIEEYHNDKPYPSCLIYGKDMKGKPLHVVCAFSPIILIIHDFRTKPILSTD